MLADVLELRYDKKLAIELEEKLSERILEEKRTMVRNVKIKGFDYDTISEVSG